MSGATRAKILAYLMERYVKPDALQLAVMEAAPILGMLPKDEQMGGRYMKLPMIRTGSQGRSATYANAVTNANGTQTVGFEVQYVSNYHVAKIDGDTLDDSKGDDNALEEAMELEMDGAIANIKKDLQHGVFGDVGGSRGRVGSITTGLAGATCRIVLLNPSDAKFYEEGVVLEASANDGTASGHALRSGSATIASVDAVNGYLEFASAVTGLITGLLANDYLFAQGDFKKKISGFRGWIPTTDPVSGDSFHTVDRTANTRVLSGIRVSGSNKPTETAFIDLAAMMDHYDATPDLATVNPIRWGKMVVSIGADAQNRVVTVKGTDARIGYQAIMIDTARGRVPLVSDGGCDINEGLLLTKDSWKLGSVGKLVHIIDDDGLTMRRDTTTDGWIIEVKSRANLGCKQPGKNGRVSLPSI
jgi:hypothetical protein